jgi:hypothetical protein
MLLMVTMRRDSARRNGGGGWSAGIYLYNKASHFRFVSLRKTLLTFTRTGSGQASSTIQRGVRKHTAVV